MKKKKKETGSFIRDITPKEASQVKSVPKESFLQDLTPEEAAKIRSQGDQASDK